MSEKGVFCYACNGHGRTMVGVQSVSECRWCFGTGRRYDGPAYLEEQDRYDREHNRISDEQDKRDYARIEDK
jgi:hypothetical protein